jgi:hypothetical protein
MKQYNINRLFSIFCLSLFFVATQGFAQESYLLQELRIPQIVQENPGAVVPYDAHVSFPGLGKVHVGINLPFSPFSISTKMFNKMKKRNSIRTWVENDPIHFGFRNGKNYFSIITAIKTDMNITLKKDLFALLVEGNDREKNEILSLVGNDFISLNAYAEFGIGYNREINENVSFGINAKYLLGLANAHTKKADLTLTTGENYHELILNQSMQGNLACIYDIYDIADVIKDTSKNIWDNLLKRTQLSDFKNHGVSFDVGARYKINDIFEINASVLDLGFIKWKSNTYKFDFENKPFHIDGYRSVNIFDDFTGKSIDSVFKEYFKELGDSLLNNFESELEKLSSYIKCLNTRFNIGFSIYASPNDRFNLNFKGIFISNIFVPSGSVSYTRNVGKWFDVVIGNTFKQNSLLNPGLGLNFTAHVFQFYIVADYTNTLAYIDRAKNLNVILGINFVAPLGKKIKASYMY